MSKINYAPAGDQGIVMKFGTVISEEINRQIRGMCDCLKEKRIPGIIEVIPSFSSLLVIYDPLKVTYGKLQGKLEALEKQATTQGSGKKTVYTIPVCYGGAYGEDLCQVAEHGQISEEEVIKLHSGRDYLIYMLGFLPGFVYLGGMDERIFCPRLSSPRTIIPKGSVGIGGEQTGIYPLASPGGWRLIGRTPLNVYDGDRDPAILYKMGEYIRFSPITEKEYLEIEQKILAGTYTYEVEIKDE